MAHDKSLFELVRHPIKVRMLQVKRVVVLSPRMRRITLTGPELEGFATLAPEDHVKVFFPRPGQGTPIVPTLGPLGLILPKLGEKPIARDYTPRRYDAAARELDIDFYLHGQGAAASWAAGASEGQLLGVAGPRGSFMLKRSFDHQLFVGDETALPEFARRIEGLEPHTRVFTIVVVDGPEEEHAFTHVGPLTARWVHRSRIPGETAAALCNRLSELALPPSEGFAWLAGEASEVRAAYRHLVHALAFPVSRVHVSGHWARGVVNHDHHAPIELSDR